MAMTGAWALATQLAMGVLIDGSASAEVRAAGLQAEGDVDALAPLQAVPALLATPSVRAALELDQHAASVSYALQLSAIPAPASLAVFHRGEAGFELQVSPLVRTRGNLAVNGGALDPLQAQLTLADTGEVDDQVAALPYLDAAASLGADARLSRRLRLETGVNATTIGIGDGAAAMHTGSLHVATVGALTRHDEARLAVGAQVALRGAAADAAGNAAEYDAAPGLSATAGLTHTMLRDTGVAVELGALALALMRGEEVVVTLVRPLALVRVFTLTGLGGDRALAANAQLGLTVTPNPRGGIAESRLGGALGVEARLATGIAVGVTASGFAPQHVIGGAPLDLAPSGQAALRGGWSINDALRLNGSLALTGRAPVSGATFDAVIATLGISGNAELWHSGGRPRGTDTRAGAELGVASVGSAPAPGTLARREPERPRVVAVPPPPPPELLPPPVTAPAEPPPPSPPIRPPRAKQKPRPTLLQGEPATGVTIDPTLDPLLDPRRRDDDDDGDDDDDDGKDAPR